MSRGVAVGAGPSGAAVRAPWLAFILACERLTDE